ncbi:probable lipid phosphate phosphatase beta [Carica papaya]|uniref:probable lipid phosphate phosphatase beta n=1 Tax=Carica papaya TaxID=3649 RepID=UPI000B8CE83B|nr:probable lipid phosphate phosphatase beta [Carica papaya]XP_021901946.1 probable lipid phosphate phosphatase beta [Carica papaya]XP_021901947.1 probable lipid phosphate phosphatase beta [Carica papaya]
MASAQPPLKANTTNPPTATPLPRHLLTVDATLSHALHTLTKPILPHSFLLLLEYSADFRLSFPVSLALLLAPPLSPLRFSFLLPFVVGLLLDLVFIGFVKTLFRRSRPHYNPSMSPVISIDNFSFPSGHATRVFFVAASVSLSAAAIERFALTFSSKPWGESGNGWFLDRWIPDDYNKEDMTRAIVFGVWIWASLTAISRVLLGRHFLLDVLAGACFGILEALFVFRFLRF